LGPQASFSGGTAQPAKAAPFARGAQPAAVELMSEKRPQASFSN
jgi:hypothetical protein